MNPTVKDNNYSKILDNSPLGNNQSQYKCSYSADILYPIPRKHNREELGIDENVPFKGFDLWRAYEFTWIDNNYILHPCILEFYIPCDSCNIVESKSLKLYLFSFRDMQFENFKELESIILKDLKSKTGSEVTIKKIDLDVVSDIKIYKPKGISLDNLSIGNGHFDNFSLLISNNTTVSETIFFNAFQSNCPVTSQPDWATVEINYHGPKLNHSKLAEYLGSFRNNNEFHEQCIERIFMTLLNYCKPHNLTVKGYFTRRGGIDINPFRSLNEIYIPKEHIRLIRQ